jgi:sulfite exporter TauE/SafE
MNEKQVFKHRLTISGLILVFWFSSPFTSFIGLALTLLGIGALIGTFIRVRPERKPKNIRWFIVIALGSVLSYLLGTLVAAVGNAAAQSTAGNASLMSVATGFLLLLTSVFFLARIGIEGYLAWVARKNDK